jgi:transcriptional regulator with XRE-family HTH domain
MKEWEKKVLSSPGAPERVEQIEEELRLAAGLTSLREQAGLSQRELAALVGVRQPRIAAIERSRNVTLDVLERYVAALGGHIELSVVRNGKRVALISGRPERPAAITAAVKTTARKTTVAKATAAKKAPAKAVHPARTRTVRTAAPAKRTSRKQST